MNLRLLKCSLVAVTAVMATLPGFAQTTRSNESGVHPSIKLATTPQIGHIATITSPALTFSTNGPVDPTNPSRPLFCNKNVQREFGKAFMKTRNGEDRGGLAEAGRSIEFNEGAITFGSWASSEIDNGEANERANKMNISKDDSTIAFFHTHGNSARPVPSAKDLKGDVPDFVISQRAVYVTIPGTDSYVKLDPAVCK